MNEERFPGLDSAQCAAIELAQGRYLAACFDALGEDFVRVEASEAQRLRDAVAAIVRGDESNSEGK